MSDIKLTNLEQAAMEYAKTGWKQVETGDHICDRERYESFLAGASYASQCSKQESLKEQADPKCTICGGSGQDTTTTGYTGVCDCVGLHDAGIEPSGQGEEPIKELANKFTQLRYKSPNQPEGISDHEFFHELSDGITSFVNSQTALLSRQLLRSEQKNKAKDEEIQRLREALAKIIQMNRQQASDQYGNSDRAENWSCVKIAREALNPSSKTTKEDI